MLNKNTVVFLVLALILAYIILWLWRLSLRWPYDFVTPSDWVLYPEYREALANPEKWNREWEATLPRITPQTAFHQLREEYRAQFGENSRPKIYENSQLVQSTCGLRSDIGRSTVKLINDFRQRWLDATPAQRQSHLLRAISTACSIARNMHNARAYCIEDELSLKRLSNDPQAVPTLLQIITPADVSVVPKEIYFIPSVKLGKFRKFPYNATDLDKAILYNIYILRTKLIYQTALYTLCSVLGIELPKVDTIKNKFPKIKGVTPKHHFSPQGIVDDLNRLGFAQGAEMAKEFFEAESKALKAERKKKITACSRPGCIKIEESEDGKFKRCSNCYDTMGRSVMYCGGSCQKKDWRLRHKTICGKPVKAEDAEQIGVSRADD